ncbi:MAG TPA: FAD-dependent oxidoreductase [Pseudonocardiaceae bacterium]|jgi:2-polyprenyl-6-methoxyphenol hydroxylase-like FAD-dependent oxidoreductase
MRTETTSVLVLGGGLVGLSAAVFLAWRGVPTILVEKHAGSSLHPRAIGYTPRTMELYRSVGLADQIPEAPKGLSIRRVRAESLAGAWFEEQQWTPVEQAPVTIDYSPTGGAGLAQDKLEPLLRAHAVKLGADVRFSMELTSVDQDADGVRAVMADGTEIRADYLVAADGHRSPVREQLGIGRTGRGHVSTGRSVIFRAPLQDYLAGGVAQFTIDQPDFSAFLTTYGDGRWLLFYADELDDTSPEALRALIDKAIGRTDLDVEIVVTGRWVTNALVADTYSDGRIFLAGDAAHALPPNRGAYSANTGIEDAHNLAWKLAAVVNGESDPALLASYEDERRPIALLCHDQIFARLDNDAEMIIDDQAMAHGYLYRSTVLPDAGPDLPPARRPEAWAGQPGTRVRHLWLTRSGARLSTLDITQRGWTLLGEAGLWRDAARRAPIPVDYQQIGVDYTTDVEEFRTAFGITDTGATLIRPDGYIAWRCEKAPEDPAAALAQALNVAALAGQPRACHD